MHPKPHILPLLPQPAMAINIADSLSVCQHHLAVYNSCIGEVKYFRWVLATNTYKYLYI